MKKLSLVVFLLASISNAQQVNITYTTLNPAEQKKAEHWGMTEKQWIEYSEYMEVEGKYFYEKVDPLTVMAMNSRGEQRQEFMVKQLMFERSKIKKEVSLANDMWRIQNSLYGEEPLVDFRSLPWIDRDEEDWRLYKHPNTYESIKLRQDAAAAEQKNDPNFERQDELLVFVAENCVKCKERVEVIKKEQPLNAILIPLLNDNTTIDQWIKNNNLENVIDNMKIKIHIYDPKYFEQGFTPKPDSIYQARKGKIVREL